MGKYNPGKNETTSKAKRSSKTLIAEVAALAAIVIIIVALALVGANNAKNLTSLFAVERDTYVLDSDYVVSDIDFKAIGSTEGNLRLNHACCIDLNGYMLDLNGYVLNLVPTRISGPVTIKNGKIKNGTLIVDTDDSDLIIDSVTFDSTLKYSLRTAGSNMMLNTTSVQSRSIKATGGLLTLENAKIDDITLYSDFCAIGSTTGVLTTAIEDSTLYAEMSSIAGVKVKYSTTLKGEFNCPVDIEEDASASADGEEDERITLTVNDQVGTINVNTDAIVTLMRDGDRVYGATVNTLNVNKENATINIQNCATVGHLNAYANNTKINLSGSADELIISGASTLVAQKASITKRLVSVDGAIIDMYGTAYDTQIYGGGSVKFYSSSYLLRINVNTNSTATVELDGLGAVAAVYGNQSHVYIQESCHINMIVDMADGTANIEGCTPLWGATEEEMAKEIKSYIVPIEYVDTTCTADGYIKTAPGADETSSKIDFKSIKSIGHRFEYTTIRKATEEEAGLGVRVCTVCGVTSEYEIPKERSIYSPTSLLDYLAGLFEAGEYDYSMEDNSGYILNYTEDEGGQSSAEGTGVLYDVLFFKTCFVHFSVEKNKETKTMSLFGDINIDATLLKGYAVEPDWNSIDESKASSVSHFHLAAAIKNSVIAYTYSGPEFVFLREGEYFIDVNDILNGYISGLPIFPEGTTIDDIIDLIETVRKLVYYFEKYEAPFKFVLQALMQRIDLSSMVPGISWIKKSEDEENTYSFSFEYLAQSIKEFENDSIKEYLDGIFGNGFVNGISNYITQIPNETVDEIYKTIVYIAGTFGGMSEDALIDDFNILLSILLNDVVGNMPGETQTIKTNIREHLGNPIDLRYARERYNDYTVYELAYGRLGVDTDIDVDVYLKNQEEFKELWEASISTVETVILDASISTIVDTLLENFDSYTDITTLDKLLDELAKLDKYFSYVWHEDGKGTKLTSSFELRIPDNFEETIISGAKDVVSYIKELIGFFNEDEEYYEDEDEGEGGDVEEEHELVEIFSFKRNDVDGYFTEFKFDWLFADLVSIQITLDGIETEVKSYGIEYYNSYNGKVYLPLGEGPDDDITMLTFHYDEKTRKISNLAINIILSDGMYIIYNEYDTYIEAGLAIEQISGGSANLRLDYKDGKKPGKLIIAADDTPSTVVQKAFNLFDKIKFVVNADVDETNVDLIELSFDGSDIDADGKQSVRLDTSFEFDDCCAYEVTFGGDDGMTLIGYNFDGDHEIRDYYGVTQDEFVRNEKGFIRGAKMLLYEKDYKKFGGTYVYNNRYSPYGLEFELGKQISFKWDTYSTIYLDVLPEELNTTYWYDEDEVFIFENGDIYTGGTELNPDFNPTDTDANRWLKRFQKIGNVSDGINAALNYDRVVEGDIDLDYKKNNAFYVSYEYYWTDWAHYTRKLSDTEFAVDVYSSIEKDTEGKLTFGLKEKEHDYSSTDEKVKYALDDINFSYYRYRTNYDSEDEAYKNWKYVDGKYVLEQYEYEGGEINYDAYTDTLYGKIIEHHYYWYWDEQSQYHSGYAIRTKYEVFDDKYDGGRRFTLQRYRYDDDNQNYYTVESTEIYGMIDVIFGERQDALKITLGSEWLAKFEDLMHDAGIVNQHRSTKEIRATNATETYQILLYKTRNTQKYDGVAIRIYDFEIAVVVDREEFMLKFDARRFGLPLNIDIDIHPYDITDLRFIITYDDGFRINFVSDSEELNGNISFGDFVFTAFREHKTGEWDYRLKFNKHNTKPNSDGTYPYYAAGFISKDEDIDFLLGVFNREDKTDTWLARLFDIDSQREIIKFNYDKIDKVFKLDFTLLQIGSASINISTMMSEAEYSFAFNIMGELDEDYVHETAGKNSIEILNILTVSGNRQTGAISVYFIASLVDEQLAFRFMYDPFGDNGFTIYRYDPTNFDGYKGDYMDDMEYISVIYNLNNYTMRVVIRGYFEAIVELDDDDPTIRNAHLWISIINLERDFRITELEDGRIMAVSNIWNNTLGIYEPSTFVIELSEVHLDDYQEIIANIEKGLGTGAQYVGQLDYKNDGGYRTINFAIITQLQIKSDVEIYTEVNEHEYRDLFINVPFSYLGDGMFYDCHFNFKVSNDPAITVLDKETGEQITVAEHTEKFLEEMRAKFED